MSRVGRKKLFILARSSKSSQSHFKLIRKGKQSNNMNSTRTFFCDKSQFVFRKLNSSSEQKCATMLIKANFKIPFHCESFFSCARRMKTIISLDKQASRLDFQDLRSNAGREKFKIRRDLRDKSLSLILSFMTQELLVSSQQQISKLLELIPFLDC